MTTIDRLCDDCGHKDPCGNPECPMHRDALNLIRLDNPPGLCYPGGMDGGGQTAE